MEKANLRRLSHTDFSVLDIDEKKRAMFQLELDTRKQRKMFSEIIGEPEEYIADVLVIQLQNNTNKDTLWRLFGEVLYRNIERNLKGTKLCKSCGKRYKAKEKDFSSCYCLECKAGMEKEKGKERVRKHRENKQIFQPPLHKILPESVRTL